MSVARFTVTAQLDSAGGKKKGTVTIDRETGVVTVRPHRSHAVYHAKLDEIADMIVKKAIASGFERVFEPKKAARRR